MNKSAIQKFAIQARKDLIAQVKQQAYNYGIDANGFGDENATTVNGVVLPTEKINQRKELINAIKDEGYEAVMDRVSYTWFNRFIALRYMEVNDYLPTHIRVFTNDKGEFKPAILKDVLSLDLKGLDKDKVIELLNNPTGEEDLYRYLLLTQCNALNEELPEMFEKLGSYEELLLPLKILSDESVIAHLVNDIEEDDFKEAVEIIGWLYQYYNTEPKSEVYAKLKKNIKVTKENIPPATQIFTPDWIVRYMVENSLGRLWLEGHEDTSLKSNWKYYIDEAEQTESVQAELNKIKENYKNIKLEDIKIIDPCMGSGHILVYAFDVLVQIYESQGYSSRDSASLILENNLYGLDIDERAYQLAYFALMMKGRSYDRRFLTRDVKPQVYCPRGYADGLEYGSLVLVEELEEKPVKTMEITLYDEDYKEKLNRWNFKRLLNQNYDVVISNPPYKDLDDLNYKFVEWSRYNYKDFNSDLIDMFLLKTYQLCKNRGYISIITTESWMFLPSYIKIREMYLKNCCITNLLHMDIKIMTSFPTVAVIFNKMKLNYRGTYLNIDEKGLSNETPTEFPTKSNKNNIVQFYEFYKLPNYVFSFWCSDTLKNILNTTETVSDKFKIDSGLKTGRNQEFLRLWHEVSMTNTNDSPKKYEDILSKKYKWYRYNKGGGVRKWYGNMDYVINLHNGAYDIKSKVSKDTYRLRTTENYFKKNIAFSLVGKTFSCKFCDEGILNDIASNAIYFDENKEVNFFLIALLNTNIVNDILEIINPTLGFTIDAINNIPYISVKNMEEYISEIVKNNIEYSKTDWILYETSWDFEKHPLINGTSIKTAFENWEDDCNNRFNKLKANEEELNRIFIDIYGLLDELTPEVEDKDVTVSKADLVRDIKSFISYAVGCMFGRYSLDIDGLAYAGGDFDSSKYTTFIPYTDNIIPISDEDYFNDKDIVNRFIEFVKVVYGENTLEENLGFIAKALKRKGDSSREIIRGYFLNDFYKDHLKTYQKRPIYWLFDSGKKNGFKALIYMHRYQKDLLAKVRTDYVHEQQERYSTQLDTIKQSLLNASASEKVKLTKIENKLKEQALEIQQYEEKIKHLADKQIEIELDDGVKNNYALFSDVLAVIKK